MKTVLITGAGGFIGSHLSARLAQNGERVRALDLRFPPGWAGADKPFVEVIEGDICAEERLPRWLAGVEVVFHLASAHLDVSLPDEHYRRVNVGGALRLARTAQRAGVKRFVHVSSVGVIGDVKDPPADETSPCRPENIYEQTKLEGERAVLDLPREDGFQLVVARPAWVYGPGCPRTQKLFRQIEKGRFPIFGTGNNLRHPVFIQDVLDGLELCAQADGVDGEIFILAGSEPVTVMNLTRQISAALGVKPPRLRLPLGVGQWAGMGIETAFKVFGRRPPFSRRSVDFFRKHNAYSIAKAERQLGYQPKVSLPEGMAITAQWLRQSSQESD